MKLERAAQFWAKREWILLPVLLGAGYFLLQWTQLQFYGTTWDEPLHRNWGKIFWVSWQTDNREILNLMPGNGIYYGPLYYFLSYGLSEFLFKGGWLRFYEANHVLNLVVSSIGTVYTFQFGRLVGGRKVGLLAFLFIVLFPPFLAHSHYNPKDIPLMTGLLVTAYYFLLGLKRSSRTYLILSGFLMGVSIALKVSALLMAPVFLATYVVWCVGRAKKSSWSHVLRSDRLLILLTLLACIAGTYLFWPSAWADPLLIVRSVSFFLRSDFWPGYVLFFGTEYTGADLPWYYIVFEYAAVMPVLFLISFLAGMAVFLRHIRSCERLPDGALLLLWIIFPLLFSMKPGLVRYDGMRQFFFVLPAIAVVAAFGFNRLLVLLQSRARRRSASAIFMGLVVFSLVSQVLTVHPFEGSYRNEIVRAMIPAEIDHRFQIEYWGPSYKQGMDWLIKNADHNPVICVPTAGILVTWYPWREDFTFECSEKSTYVMFFTRYSEAKQYEALRNPIYTIRRMNSTLLAIYKVK